MFLSQELAVHAFGDIRSFHSSAAGRFGRLLLTLALDLVAGTLSEAHRARYTAGEEYTTVSRANIALFSLVSYTRAWYIKFRTHRSRPSGGDWFQEQPQEHSRSWLRVNYTTGVEVHSEQLLLYVLENKNNNHRPLPQQYVPSTRNTTIEEPIILNVQEAVVPNFDEEITIATKCTRKKTNNTINCKYSRNISSRISARHWRVSRGCLYCLKPTSEIQWSCVLWNTYLTNVALGNETKTLNTIYSILESCFAGYRFLLPS